MTILRFYEKPGCASNARQKHVLHELGYTLEVYDLLRTPWTAESLRPFFGDLAVAEWFNMAAPAIKQGLVDPHALDAKAAIAAMLNDPLLIRRPLMLLDGVHYCGFMALPERRLPRHLEGCSQDAGQLCPAPNPEGVS